MLRDYSRGGLEDEFYSLFTLIYDFVRMAGLEMLPFAGMKAKLTTL